MSRDDEMRKMYMMKCDERDSITIRAYSYFA